MLDDIRINNSYLSRIRLENLQSNIQIASNKYTTELIRFDVNANSKSKLIFFFI